jgi:hypothetical protein
MMSPTACDYRVELTSPGSVDEAKTPPARDTMS